MGRREEISKELDQLVTEIERDNLLAHGERPGKTPPMPQTHVRVKLVLAQHAPTGFQIRISMEPVDDGGPS